MYDSKHQSELQKRKYLHLKMIHSQSQKGGQVGSWALPALILTLRGASLFPLTLFLFLSVPFFIIMLQFSKCNEIPHNLNPRNNNNKESRVQHVAVLATSCLQVMEGIIKRESCTHELTLILLSSFSSMFCRQHQTGLQPLVFYANALSISKLYPPSNILCFFPKLSRRYTSSARLLVDFHNIHTYHSHTAGIIFHCFYYYYHLRKFCISFGLLILQ